MKSLLDKIKETFKNWWILILAVIGFVLDSGFDVINPVLESLGISDAWANGVKAVFVVYGMYKAYKTKPPTTQKPDNVVLDAPDEGPGKVVPPTGPTP